MIGALSLCGISRQMGDAWRRKGHQSGDCPSQFRKQVPGRSPCEVHVEPEMGRGLEVAESLARVILLTIARHFLLVSRVWVYCCRKPKPRQSLMLRAVSVWKAFMRNEAAGLSIDRLDTEP
jgi:hypothetical protein